MPRIQHSNHYTSGLLCELAEPCQSLILHAKRTECVLRHLSLACLEPKSVIRKYGLILATVWAKVFPSYARIITKVMETMIYSSKKEGKDTWQSILRYFLWMLHWLEKPNQKCC